MDAKSANVCSDNSAPYGHLLFLFEGEYWTQYTDAIIDLN